MISIQGLACTHHSSLITHHRSPITHHPSLFTHHRSPIRIHHRKKLNEDEELELFVPRVVLEVVSIKERIETGRLRRREK
jgi:hypothetical protein